MNKVKIGFLQFDSRMNENINSILNVNKKYCQLHNYNYIFKLIKKEDIYNPIFEQYLYDLSDYYRQLINICYYKFTMIEQYMNNYDYLVYGDSDVIINNPNIKIEDLIDNQHDIYMFRDQGQFVTTKNTLNAANAISKYCNQMKIPYIKNPLETLQKIKIFNESVYSVLCKVVINPEGLSAGFMIINCNSKLLKEFIIDFKKFYPIFGQGFFDQGCIATLLRRNKYKNMLKILPTILCGNPSSGIIKDYSLDYNKAFICHFYGSKPSKEMFNEYIERIKNNIYWKQILNKGKL